jgi:CRP-like cAMP-binding protein
MLIDQGDFLWEMDHLFVKNYMAVSAKINFEGNSVIFREGDKASHFYTLITGSVRLTTGEQSKEIYIVDKAGEGFGWSSLVERNYYSATAETVEPTFVLQFERSSLIDFLTNNPEHGFEFYRRLAGMLGNRLIQFYKIINP